MFNFRDVIDRYLIEVQKGSPGYDKRQLIIRKQLIRPSHSVLTFKNLKAKTNNKLLFYTWVYTCKLFLLTWMA